MELNKIYNEDCLQTMSKIPDNFVDLIITDPPYNISKENDNRDISKANSPIMRRGSLLNYDFGKWDNMKRSDFLRFTNKWLKEGCRILKDGGTFISFFNKEDISYLGWVAKRYGIRTRTIFTWHKTNPVPSFRKVNYLSSTEFIWIGSKGNKAWTFNFLMQKEMHNFYETSNASAYSETKHPTEKPIELIDYLVNIHSNENNVIYDCFVGSGTTIVSCLKYKRKYIGSEISKEYCDLAEKRILPYKMQTILF